MRSQRSARIDKTLRKFNLNLLLYDIKSSRRQRRRISSTFDS